MVEVFSYAVNSESEAWFLHYLLPFTVFYAWAAVCNLQSCWTGGGFVPTSHKSTGFLQVGNAEGVRMPSPQPEIRPQALGALVAARRAWTTAVASEEPSAFAHETLQTYTSRGG